MYIVYTLFQSNSLHKPPRVQYPKSQCDTMYIVYTLFQSNSLHKPRGRNIGKNNVILCTLSTLYNKKLPSEEVDLAREC